MENWIRDVIYLLEEGLNVDDPIPIWENNYCRNNHQKIIGLKKMVIH